MEESATDLALVKALDEIKNVNKDISKTFVFRKDKILAKDRFTKEEEANRTIEAFEAISSKANIIEGLESITIQGTYGRVDITHINDYYLTIVTSKEADDETINNLTHVLAPTIFKIIQDMTPSTNRSPEIIAKTKLDQKQAVEIAPSQSAERLEALESNLPTPEFAEFTVDDMGRLGIISGSSDSVRLHIITVGHWTELFGENKIQRIIIKEANTGKTIECKYEVSRDTERERTSLVLVPELLQRKLKTKKGAKVLIKPIIQQDSPKESLENESLEENTITEKPQQPLEGKSHFLPDSPNCQLMVEDMSSFSSLSSLSSLRGLDIVRFDEALTQRWKEFYGERKIEEVTISDTVLGKTVRCKFKIDKDPKFEGKGLIQIPKSIRKELGVKVGSLVTVKPVIR
jgi:hypothetical protein